MPAQPPQSPKCREVQRRQLGKAHRLLGVPLYYDDLGDCASSRLDQVNYLQASRTKCSNCSIQEFKFLPCPLQKTQSLCFGFCLKSGRHPAAQDFQLTVAVTAALRKWIPQASKYRDCDGDVAKHRTCTNSQTPGNAPSCYSLHCCTSAGLSFLLVDRNDPMTAKGISVNLLYISHTVCPFLYIFGWFCLVFPTPSFMHL